MPDPIRLYLDEDAPKDNVRVLRLLDARSAMDMRNWLEFLSNWR